MLKKISLVFTMLFCLMLFSDKVLAEENITENDVYTESIDLTESANRIVSEEEVILDFMEKENVDRSTAMDKLGINENDYNN